MSRRTAIGALTLALLAGVGVVVALVLRPIAPDRDRLMAQRLTELWASAGPSRMPCSAWLAQRPLVLLALGQSNAGNHGQAAASTLPSAQVQVMNAGVCTVSADPLPGATGRGGSLWSLLPSQLAAVGVPRPVLLQVVAVDASLLDDWTRARAPINRHLAHTLSANLATGLTPDLVLWQQGEADALAGTSPGQYTEGLRALAEQLASSGVRAPILLAKSTVCRSAPHLGLRGAVQSLAASDRRFLPGPDTDSIDARFDGCHFSAIGREQAAARWAAVISQLAPARHGARSE